MSFPKNFIWGAATASFQIEGAGKEDGKGQSIWDTFCATPGKVANGDDGMVACDHYHRYPEDIQIMKDMGIDSYRFSIAWPRLFPSGDSVREQRGFAFYDKLIDELLDNGITPLPTMFHWDLPQTLQDNDGWANRDTVNRFVDYGASLIDAYGDRISKWVTLNEPWCFTWLGYMSGVHAPGVKNFDHAVAAAHHSVIAHSQVIEAAKSIRPDLIMGQALNMTNYRVMNPEDADVVQLASFQDSHINRWWLDAEHYGHYPQDLVDYFGERLSRVMLPGDEYKLRAKSDFLGINYYSDSFLSSPRPTDKAAMDGGPHPFPQRASGAVPEPTTDMGWPLTPGGISDLLVRIKKDWPMIQSIAITENGAAYDYPVENGEVNDYKRVEYILTHLQACAEAIELGVPLDAYYIWSLLDNFEWAEGYQKRFGIVHVDFETLERIPKLSSKVYKDVIAYKGTNIGKVLDSIRV
jgi:beta-glucosidase